MIINVAEVKPLPDYNLLLTFKNGEKKKFDCTPLLKYKINEPLKNKAFFETAKVQFGTVVWNDNIDIDPEYLYEESVTTD